MEKEVVLLFRIVCEGFDKAKEKCLQVLDDMKIQLTEAEKRDILLSVSRY